ncbi:50S ribosomal protein L22 [candidate division KSB1 bacterium]|nr:50S ribosomal protein L22 [candidate division KSB1 bacterium]
MEAKALAKWIRVSPYKLRRVANLVRGMDVDAALNILHFNNSGSSLPIEKAIRSAVANLMNKQEASRISSDDLYVKELKVDGAFMLKRFRAASMGRAMRIRKRTSHISVVVAEKEE